MLGLKLNHVSKKGSWRQIPIKFQWKCINFHWKMYLKMSCATWHPLCLGFNSLRPSHAYSVSNLTIIGSDDGLLPLVSTKPLSGILSIGPLGTNFSEIIIKILTFSFKKMHWKMSSGKWRPFCLGLNVLMCLWTMRWHAYHMLYTCCILCTWTYSIGSFNQEISVLPS